MHVRPPCVSEITTLTNLWEYSWQVRWKVFPTQPSFRYLKGSVGVVPWRDNGTSSEVAHRGLHGKKTPPKLGWYPPETFSSLWERLHHPAPRPNKSIIRQLHHIMTLWVREKWISVNLCGLPLIFIGRSARMFSEFLLATLVLWSWHLFGRKRMNFRFVYKRPQFPCIS